MSDMEAREAIVTLLTGNTTACWDSALLPNEYLAGEVADAILSSGLVVTAAEADRRVADMRERAAVEAGSFGMISERNLEPYWEGFNDATGHVEVAIRALPLSPTESEA